MAGLNEDQAELPGDELVAYLDGELAPEDARRVEERLTADPEYRRQLRDLDQAWEALDALPKPTADDHFARTTIEMVSVAAEREVSAHKAKAAAASRKRFVVWFVVGLAGVVAGFFAASWLLPNPDEALLADLPVIHQFDMLNEIEDVELLRRLPEVAPVDQWATDGETIQRELAGIKSAAAPSRHERRRWVQGLAPEQKAVLASKQKRFADLSERPAEQQRLRELERQIRLADDAEQLQTTMIAYNRWLAERRPGERADLRMLATDERLGSIRYIVRQEAERASRHLSAEDSARLREEIMEIYHERKSAFERSMRRRDHDNRMKLEGPETWRAVVVLNWELRNDERDDKTRDRLIQQLSDEAQEYWDQVSRRGRFARHLQLRQWISEAMRPTWDAGTLEEFFANELKTAEQEWLLSLRPEEMQWQLVRLYLAKKYGLSDAEQWLGKMGERGNFPPGPPPSDSRRRESDRERQHERDDGRNSLGQERKED